MMQTITIYALCLRCVSSIVPHFCSIGDPMPRPHQLQEIVASGRHKLDLVGHTSDLNLVFLQEFELVKACECLCAGLRALALSSNKNSPQSNAQATAAYHHSGRTCAPASKHSSRGAASSTLHVVGLKGSVISMSPALNRGLPFVKTDAIVQAHSWPFCRHHKSGKSPKPYTLCALEDMAALLRDPLEADLRI